MIILVFAVSLESRAPVAQWIEYLASNQGVGGSNPSGRTTYSRKETYGFLSWALLPLSGVLQVWGPQDPNLRTIFLR